MNAAQTKAIEVLKNRIMAAFTNQRRKGQLEFTTNETNQGVVTLFATNMSPAMEAHEVVRIKYEVGPRGGLTRV